MPKYILRHGCERPTAEACICPDCGHGEVSYKLSEQAFHNSYQATLHCSATGTPLVRPLVPTFTCPQCGCIWQWEKDDPKVEISDAGNKDK